MSCTMSAEADNKRSLPPASKRTSIGSSSNTAAAFLASQAAYGLDDRCLHVKLSTGAASTPLRPIGFGPVGTSSRP